MMIWLVAGILVVLAAALGYALGGIRTGIVLMGTVLAAMLAKAVGALCASVVPLIGLKNPVWQSYIPPLVGFVVVGLVGLIVAFVVHHLFQKQYRNKTDEYLYARWDRLNRRTGAAVGAGLGGVWLVLLGIVAYVPGYLSTQLADAAEDSALLRTANNLTHGMETTGLLKIVERFQPATEAHYLASDILGLIYSNPAIHSRLASYPPFLGLAEKPEIAELANDPEVNTMIQSRAGLSQILAHGKIRAVLDNHDLVNELLALDFRDLYGYLLSGTSEKYKDESILGRWRLSVRRSIGEMKEESSEVLPRVEFNLLRKALNVFLDEMTIGFTTDNRAIVKVKAKDEARLLQTVGRASAASENRAPAPAPDGEGGEFPPPATGTGGGLTARGLVSRAIPQPQENQGGMSDDLRRRYGLGPSGARPIAPAAAPVMIPRAPAKPAPTTALEPIMSNGEGRWAKAGDDYTFTFAREGKEITFNVRVRDHLLTARLNGRVLVFNRI